MEPLSPTGIEVWFCDGCGRPLAMCTGCRRELDPPRWCVHCGRRLTVRIMPTHVRATCREHGEIDFP